MSYPQTLSETQAANPSSQPNMPILPIRRGMPFKKMHRLREDIGKAMTKLAQAKTLVANAQKTEAYPPKKMERLRSDVRLKSADLVCLQKKLAPLEANFKKVQAQQKGTNGNRPAPKELQPPTKKQKKTDDRPGTNPSGQAPVVIEPMMNTATLEVTLSPGGCALTANECQYDHLERLRRQYARPFELFCEEMDSIGDSCLTGICLAMPNMPWSIAVSRLAFLTKSTLDSHGGHHSDVLYLSTGTTVGCQHHMRYIKLAELMVIQDWRDFMRWAHHQSHVFNLCGQPSCIKLKHMCLEPVDCLSSRTKCRTDFDEFVKGARLPGQPTNRGLSSTPTECSSPGCWPPCLHAHRASSILHSVAVEYAAFNHVSFGSVTSSVKQELYTPVNEHQLGKLVSNKDIGLAFPFQISYGHIFVTKREDNLMVEVDTLLPIPSMYTSEEMQHILQKLPAWTDISFNFFMSSIFWNARRRNAPSLAMSENDSNLNTRFDHRSPRYQCPFCHGFDNYFDPADSLVETIADFGDFVEALRHMMLAHTRVPIVRKLRFLYEETQECPKISDAWKVILGEKYNVSIARLATGEIPQAIADLWGYVASAGRMPTEVSKDVAVEPMTEHEIKSELECGNTLC
ncbi:hypothetical protein E0Z10_g8905 [Xylaria hypoxylon]|uniref:Uncharacterized protein n=1 Tax=Xylaria hypoxylon TaxID=37992 RepID=A0A4Z0YKG5_9PEZI|nr:hypothetical protein E0Z10_g8905 [Xylaria hypoxylon]